MIHSLQHPLVKHLVKLRDAADYRAGQQRVVIQGRKMITEVGASHRLLRVMVAEGQVAVPADEVVIATKSVLDKVSGVISSEGIVAELEMPSWGSLAGFNRVLALDGVSDPGNLGTLLRTALAFGWQGVYLLPGCCDPYNDKALRSAMGATFKVHLDRGRVRDLARLSAENQWQPLVADLHGDSPPEARAKVLLILGNEAKGPSEEVKAFCQRITLPMKGEIESLNVAVAGAVLMYLLR